MAIRLKSEDIDAIALRVLDYMHKRNYVVITEKDDEWVAAKEAAEILIISKGRLYPIKNHLTHRKSNSEKSRLFFLKSRLLDDYTNI